jgi:predicted permease
VSLSLGSALDALRLESKHAWRRVVRAPGVAAIIVLSLAVGMASVITLLGVVDTLYFREPAGTRDRGRVVAVGAWSGYDRSSYPDFVDLRDQARSFESMSAFAVWNYTARVGDRVAPARGLLASHSLFATLGMAPAVGRPFTADENRPSGPPVVIIGSNLRRQLFASDPRALGQVVRLAGIPFTVVGVLPASFTAPDMSPVDLMLPIESAPWVGGREGLVNRDYRWVRTVARLRPDVSASMASREASAIYRRSNVGVRAVDQATLDKEVVPVRSLREARRDPRSSTPMVALWLAALAGVVLTIACANVASLMVARGINDQHELAIHSALGAGNARLVLRMILDVAPLVVLAAGAGVAAAATASRAVTRMLLGNVVAAPPMDMRTVTIVFAIATVTCIACALGPVRRIKSISLQSALGSRSRGPTFSQRRALRTLAVSQIALAVVLVSEATLFVASIRNASREDLGFDLEHVAAADVDLRAAGFTDSTEVAAGRRALDAVRRVPGVVAAGITNGAAIPGFLNPRITVPGKDSSPPGLTEYEPSMSTVTAGFLEALAVPLRRGRLLTDDDVNTRRAVAVVSERFARIYWPNEDPMGRCVRVGRLTTTPCAEVVGIVGDRRSSPAVARGEAEVYFPAHSAAIPGELAQAFLGRELAARMTGDRPNVGSELQRALLDALPGLTAVRVRIGDAYLEAQTRSWRLGAVVVGTFATIALALAAVGVFGIWSHAVATRRRELGIRGALGATPSGLAWMVVREALVVASMGLVVGVAAALAASRLVSSMLFGIAATDPRVFVATAVVFAVMTSCAAPVPALRAALVDPRTVFAAD